MTKTRKPYSSVAHRVQYKDPFSCDEKSTMRIPGNEGRSTSSTQSSSILRHRFPHTVYFMARKQGDAIGKDAASMLVILELSLVDCCCPSSDEEEEVLLMLATASGTAAAADQHHATSAAASSSSSAAAMSSENLRRRWRELVEAAGCRDLASPPSNVDKDDGSAVAGARASTKTTMEFIPPSDALLERSIFKYIKWQDQYMAMISVLLKSRAYYQYTYSHKSQQPINRQDQEETVTTTTTTTISINPVVNLPRTEYQKPYIPPLFEAPDGDDEKSYWDRPISVSHQFPYVGIARLVRRRRQEKKERFEYRPFNKDGNFHKASSLLLGFDIVMFEYNQRMYRDEMEFVDVFRDSFASTEWRELMDLSSSSGVHEHNPLQEFSLRWAAKEAYTKALGVGLGFDFSSFQIHFEMDGSSPSLYRLLLETEPPGVSKYVSVQARVEWMENAAKDNKFIPDEIIVDYSRDHVWLFVFFPFYCGERKKAAFDTEKLGATKTDDSSIVGCACSCVGPFLRQQGNNGINVQRDDNGSFDDTAASLENLRVEVEWESLNSLVAFHSRNE